MPIASPSTRRSSGPGFGSGTSTTSSESAVPGMTVSALMTLVSLRRPAMSCGVESRGGVDESDVAVRLWRVAHLPSRLDVVLLAEEPDVVAQAQQPVEQLAGLRRTADAAERIDQPERAR